LVNKFSKAHPHHRNRTNANKPAATLVSVLTPRDRRDLAYHTGERIRRRCLRRMSSIAAADANRTAVVGSDVAAAEVSPNRYVTNRPNALFSDDLSAIARRVADPDYTKVSAPALAFFVTYDMRKSEVIELL
jgi:hypothetical protein